MVMAYDGTLGSNAEYRTCSLYRAMQPALDNLGVTNTGLEKVGATMQEQQKWCGCGFGPNRLLGLNRGRSSPHHGGNKHESQQG